MATLYITDLDGTLIRDDLSLSEFSRRELVSLLESGVPITVATARSLSSLRAILGDIPFRLPVVEFNGAFVSDYRTARHEIAHAMDPALVVELYAVIRANGVAPFVSVFDGERDLLFWQEIQNPGQDWYYRERVSFGDERLRKTDDLAPRLSNKHICFTLIDRKERLAVLGEEIDAAFGGRLVRTLSEYRYFPGWYFLSILDRRATKDQGIRALQEAWGLGGADLVVFGDEVNDAGMFRIATRAVAMANAVEEMKALAHEVIGSNQEDSVVRYIRAHAAGNGA